MEIRGRMGLDTERTGRGSTRESPSTTITGAKYYLSLVAASFGRESPGTEHNNL